MEQTELEDVARALAVNLGLLRRRLRQLPHDGDATLPEISALVRLERQGPATNSELAKAEQISPQSMGATVTALEERGLVSRTSDPEDGRRVVLAITDAGRAVVEAKRSSRARQLAEALAAFSEDDVATLRAVAPLLERLAQHL